MLGPVSTGRRANAFAESLAEPPLGEVPAERTPAERSSGAPGAPETTADQGALLSVVDKLQTLPRPELSADTKTVHRAQLIAAMENAFSGGAGERVPEQRSAFGARRAAAAAALSRLRPKTRITKGLAAGGLTLGVVAGAFGGAAVASTNALPGDTLYGLKRGMEDLRLDLAGGSTDRGRVHLDKASTRLDEVRLLMERQQAGELDENQLAEVRSTLASMHSDATEGRRLLSQAHQDDGSIAPLRALSAFNEKSSTAWSELRNRLPVQLHDVSDDVTSLFEAIEGQLRPFLPLLPADDAPSGSRSGSTGQAPEPPTGGQQQGPGSDSAAPGGSAGEHRPDPVPDGSTPAPDQQPAEVLTGGGGLLNPGDDPSGTDEPPAEDGSESPEPDVTIPPLIDGLLPGLGLDSRQAE